MRRIPLFVFVVVLCVTLGGWGITQEKIKITVWDQWTTPAQEEAINKMHALFQKMHPEVVIERSPIASPEQMLDVLKPAFVGGTAPDVVYTDIAPAFIGPLIKAGYLMDLTDVWETRGWNEKLASMSRDVVTYAGRVFGVGHELEFVPVFYNKSIFAELGVDEPTSIPELEAICDKAKAAGYIPMSFVDRDVWNAWHMFSQIVQSYCGKEPVTKAIFEGGTWKIPGIVEAVDKAFVEWVKKGYFPPDLLALSWQEGIMLFTTGMAAMHPTGTWVLDAYREQITDFEVGMFLFPRPSSDLDPVVPSLCGSGYVINANTKYSEICIDYVDFLMANEEAAKIWYTDTVRIPPLRKAFPELEMYYLLKEASEVLGREDVIFGYQIDGYTPPTPLDWLSKGLQEVMLGKVSPADFVEKWEELWIEARKEGLTKDAFKIGD